MVSAAIAANDAQRERMIEKISEEIGPLADKTVGVLGLSYKPNTDDVRDSPALAIIRRLQEEGARVRCFDPQAMPRAQEELVDVTFCKDAYDVAKDSDCLVLATEWNEFRSLDLVRLREYLTSPVLVDLRNVYARDEVEKLGFRYTGVGR